MNRSGQALDTMNLGLFVAGLVILVAMFVAPGGFTSAVKVQVNDYEPPIKADTVNFFLDEEYTNQSVDGSVYRGMYRQGRQMGVWGEDSIDTEEQAMQKLQRAVTDVFQTEYLGAMTTDGGCILNGIGGIQIIVDEEFREDGEDWMRFPVDPNGDPRVECRSRSLADAGGRSLHAVEFLDIPPRRILPYLRYRTMYRAANDVATDDTFQDILKTADRSSHTAVIDSCEESTDTECGWSPPSVSFQDDHDVENEQEGIVIDEELRPRLDEIASRVEADYEDVRIRLRIVEMEFTPYNIQTVDGFPGSWRTGCVESAHDSYTTYSSICGGDCPDDGSCSLDDPGARCSSSSHCPTVAAKPTSPPEMPSDSGEWTDDVWYVDGDCDFTAADPRPYSGDPQVAVAAQHAQVLPFDERIRAQGGGGGQCTPSCDSNDQDCYEYLGSSSRTRGAWRFDVRSFTRIQINVTDMRNRVPTRDGFRRPQFVVYYEELHEAPR